ncbi:hypothetical protein CMO93_02285 [Candidatus Woesearchaeota archaeon]|nr:hypothetical protein [Candidatus Woesearchaeota archaeon]|tara:strand:- start:26 stop:463 length:438 start_codon:yes stop_codon:yes gene_type:complete
MSKLAFELAYKRAKKEKTLDGFREVKKSRSYNIIKREYQDKWRPKIFKRDGHKCMNCQEEYHLQLCHITTANAFKRLNGYLEVSIPASFRDDNLITLCFVCHKVQHNADKGILFSQSAKNRAKSIRKLFNEIKQKRGCSTAREII